MRSRQAFYKQAHMSVWSLNLSTLYDDGGDDDDCGCYLQFSYLLECNYISHSATVSLSLIYILHISCGARSLPPSLEAGQRLTTQNAS